MNIKHLIVIGSAFLSVFSVQAATCTWNGGNWSEASNWTNGTKPNPEGGDSVIINNSGTAGAEFVIDVSEDCVKISGLTLGKDYNTPGNSFVVSGKPIQLSGDVTLRAAGARVDNDIVLTKATWTVTGSRTGSAWASVTFGGNITELTENLVTTLTLGANKFNATFDGSITLPNATLRGDAYAAETAAKTYKFNGPVKVKELINNNNDDNRDNNSFNFYTTGNEWTTLQQGNAKQGRFYPRCANAFPETTVVTFSGKAKNATSEAWALELNGFNQTIDRIEGPESTLCYVRSTTSPAGGATTLTLKGTADATAYASVQNNISLVYDPTGDYTQTFLGTANTTIGTITVSNGTFKVGGTAGFAGVTAITVADGAVFDMSEAINEGALAGVTAIEVGANAKFTMSANNTTPFTDNAVTLNLKSTSEFTIPDGVTLYLEDVYIDGQRQPGGSIAGGTGPFKGTGSVFVREKEVPTVEATWDGGAGADTALTTAANWEGDETPQLQAGGLLAHFANGGSEATVSGTATFKGFAFDGTSPTFAIRGGNADLAKLRELGITVGANHNVTNAVTTEIKADQRWTIGSGSTLTLGAPVTMNATYAVTNLGPGKITLNAENGYKGPLYFGLDVATAPALEIGAATNAFGEASDETVTLWMLNVANGLVLHDTVIERPLAFKNVGNGSTGVFSADGTNRFTKGVKFAAAGSSAGTGNLRLNLNGGRMAFEKGVSAGWPCAFYPTAGELVLHPMTGYATIHTMLLSENARLVFEKDTDNPVQMVFTTFKMTGASSVTFKAADAATLGSGGGDSVGLYLSHTSAKIDLNGFNQVFGPTYEMPNGVVTSATPAVWTTGTTAARTINSGVAFTGCAGFKLTQGTVTFTKSQASTNATVAVSAGTLAFAQDATWLGATNVVISGTGKLTVNTAKTFKNAVVSIADTGKIEIPDGVVMRCDKLVVDGTEVKSGTFGSSESTGDQTYAAHFLGKGVLTVGKVGIVIVFR